MEKLEQTISKNGYTYIQLHRNKNTALYQQTYGGFHPVAFEVFNIKTRKEGMVYDKLYPEREVFPSNEDFGKGAISLITFERAWKSYINSNKHAEKDKEEVMERVIK